MYTHRRARARAHTHYGSISFCIKSFQILLLSQSFYHINITHINIFTVVIQNNMNLVFCVTVAEQDGIILHENVGKSFC